MKIILVDTENISSKEYEYMTSLRGYRIIFFETRETVNRTIPISIAVRLSKAKIKFDFTRVKTKGKNALDFQICAIAGKVNKWNTQVYILSRDKGYDNLKQLDIHRIESIENLKVIKTSHYNMWIQKIKSTKELKNIEKIKSDKTYYEKVKIVISDICSKYSNDDDFINHIASGINSNDKVKINDVLNKKFRNTDRKLQKQLHKSLASIV